MKRNDIINKLIEEGLSVKTLVKLTDKQINDLASRMLSESTTSTVKNTTYSSSEVNAAKQKGQGFGVKDGTVTLGNDGGITVSTKEGAQEVSEKLIGKQKNIDKNHNGVIDRQDFKILKGQKKQTNEMLRFYDDDGNPIKNKKGEMDAVSDSDKKFKEKTKSKNINDKDNKSTKASSKQKDVKEEKPSAGLSKEKKSEVVKKAKSGGDIGKKGKGFEKIADKAAEKYGSKEKGKKVAAAAMWKNVQREGKETENWVKGLVENKYFHSFTSKGQIMELIKTKLNEEEVVAQEASVLPSFLTSKAIKSAMAKRKEQATNQVAANENAPVTKPKPTTKPDTKPGKPKRDPWNPAPNPGQNPQAESAPVTKPKPTTKPDTKPGKPKRDPWNPAPNPGQNPQARKK